MSEPLQTVLPVSYNGGSFEFTIPTVYDEMRVGVKMREIRQIVAGSDGDANPDNLDGYTLYYNRACATLDVLLKKSSERWVFTAGPRGPVVDSSKFPHDKTQDVLGIYNAYADALGRFRSGGDSDEPPVSDETVAG